MNLLRMDRWLILSFIVICIAFIPVFGQEDDFEPVRISSDTLQDQVLVLRVVVNNQRAFFVEGRMIGEQLALPVMTILRELRVKCQVKNDALSMKAIGTEKMVTLKFRENIMVIDGVSTPVKGLFGENDYYLILSDWVHFLGGTPVLNAENQDVEISGVLPEEPELREDGEQNVPTGERPHPIQPFNRMDLYLTGRGAGWAEGKSPGWDYSDLNLEWRTYGTIWGGRLTLGGDLEWIIEPDGDWDTPLNVYRWDRDYDWGRLTIGTQTLDFLGSIPTTWNMRGVSVTDGRYWDGLERSTNIVGQVDSGSMAELWLGDWLINTTEITEGQYRFADIWLPFYRASQLTIVIKDDEQVVDRQSVQYIPGERVLAKGDNHYIIAFGQTEDNNRYYGWAGTGEWFKGWTEDLTAGGLVMIDDDDQRQIGLNMTWRPKKNLILQAEAWHEPSANAWRLGSDWGYNQVYLQGRAFRREEGFAPFFPSHELASGLDLAQLALYWYPRSELQGIFAGEYSKEKMGWQTEYSRFETSLVYRKRALQGTTYAMWKDQRENPGESFEQNRLMATLIWDFRPNQWLEWGFDYNVYDYVLIRDQTSKEAWFRWTNNSWPRDRWMLGYGFSDNQSQTEQKIETRWNHQWNQEWGTYAGITYGWGEEGVDYTDWLLALGLEYRIKSGVYLSLGYEWNVRQPDFGQDEYRQSLNLQVSMGLLFGSGHPSIIPYGGDNQTTGAVSGIVYADLNGNGRRDSGEPGINGIRVRIDEIEITVTDSEGRYVFYNVATGIHRLSLDETTLPVVYNPVEHRRMIHVIAGSSLKEDLGVIVVGAVSGKVFIDANDNGAYDDGETTLAGVRVQTEAGDVWATTDQQGAYYIQLMAGEHRLNIDASTLPSNVKPSADRDVKVGKDGEEVMGMDLAVLE